MLAFLYSSLPNLASVKLGYNVLGCVCPSLDTLMAEPFDPFRGSASRVQQKQLQSSFE